MMCTVIPIVLSAALVSNGLGEFFKWPSWLPTTVDKHDTPGSNPTDWSGWYCGPGRPRAARITPDVHAGIMSSFDAACERHYFAIERQDSLGDDLTEFALYPGELGYRPGTRAVTTRRIDEYYNFSRLASDLKDMFSRSGKVVFQMRDKWSDPSREDIWWSTTSSIIFTELPVVPEFSHWTDNPTSSRNEWVDRCQVFGNLRPDDHGTAWTRSSQSYSDFPIYPMMKRIGFGQPLYKYNPENCVTSTVHSTMADQIQGSYPDSDPYAITNDTHRLLSDRICCVNQVLGLMDRTYHEPIVTYPYYADLEEHFNIASCTGTPVSNVVVVWDSGQHSYKLEDPDSVIRNIQWKSWVTTNYVNKSAISCDTGSYHIRVTGTETSPRLITELSREYVVIDKEWFKNVYDYWFYGNEIHEISFRFSESNTDVHMGGTDGLLYVTTTYVVPEFEDVGGVSMQVPFNRDHLTLSAHYTYNRRYGFARSGGQIDMGPVQPGRLGTSRTLLDRQPAYGCVIGTHEISPNLRSLNDVRDEEWNAYASTASYRSFNGTYSRRPDLRDRVRDHFAPEVFAKFVSDYGVHPVNDWNKIIPIDLTVAQRSRDASRVVGVSYNVRSIFEDKPTNYVDVVVRLDGADTITSITVSGGFEHSLPFAIAETYGTVTWDCPVEEQTERDGLLMDAKIGVMTRVNWDWQKLKRGEEASGSGE